MCVREADVCVRVCVCACVCTRSVCVCVCVCVCVGTGVRESLVNFVLLSVSITEQKLPVELS